MLKAFNVNETRDYIVTTERVEQAKDPSYQPTIFHLGVLTSALSSFISDSSLGFQVNGQGPDSQADAKVNLSARRREIVRFGLKGWTNFQDADGKDVTPEFQSFPIGKSRPRQGLTDASIDLVKPWISELAKEIESDNLFTGAEEKNSAAPSR